MSQNLKDGCCCNYFVHEQNMFSHITRDVLYQESTCVDDILNSLDDNLASDLFEAYDPAYNAKQVCKSIYDNARDRLCSITEVVLLFLLLGYLNNVSVLSVWLLYVTEVSAFTIVLCSKELRKFIYEVKSVLIYPNLSIHS